MYGDLREKYENEVIHTSTDSDSKHIKDIMVLKNIMCGNIGLYCAKAIINYWNYVGKEKRCRRECGMDSNDDWQWDGLWDVGFDDPIWKDPCTGRGTTPFVVEVSADDDHLDDEHRDQTLDDLDDSPDSPITACDDNEPCSSLMHSLSIGIILIISFIL